MTKVKICGITHPEDARACAFMGADYMGFIFAASPRRIEPEEARSIIANLPVPVDTVGVFVNESLERIKEIKDFCGLDAVQLHGDVAEDVIAKLDVPVIKVLNVGVNREPDEDAYPDATLLLDTYSPHAPGGTGKTFDWNLAVATARKRRIFLAGGLTPENVRDAVKMVRPYAVDVCSGVELAPGRKDHAKVERFISRAKAHAQSA